MTNAKNNDKVTSILGFKVCLVLWYSWGWQMAKYLKRYLEHKNAIILLNPLGWTLCWTWGWAWGWTWGLTDPGKDWPGEATVPGKDRPGVG